MLNSLEIREGLKCSVSCNVTFPGEKIRHVHWGLITLITQQFELFLLQYLRSLNKVFHICEGVTSMMWNEL